MESSSLDVNGGELNLVMAQLSSAEWDDVCRRMTSGSPASIAQIRSLVLDENESLGAHAAAPATCDRLPDTISKLTRLSALSLCDCRFAGGAVTRLFAALAHVPAFAKSHAAAWAPIEVLPAPQQGARLCLMRDGIADAELIDADRAAGGASRLAGVLELALTGNALVTDSGGVEAVARLFPSLRKLHLGRTGVHGEGGLATTLATSWPMLESLALNGCPMTVAGFERFVAALVGERAKAISSSKLKAPPEVAKAADKHPHRFFHLDLREMDAIAPLKLHRLQQHMKDYQKDRANKEFAGFEWVRRQSFAGGTHRKEGLVVRHAFEGDITLRVRVALERTVNDAAQTTLRSAEPGPFYVQLDDLPQDLALGTLLGFVDNAANQTGAAGKGGALSLASTGEDSAGGGGSKVEKRLKEAFRECNFPCAVTDGRGSARTWREVRVERLSGVEKPVPLLRPNGARQELESVAIGTLLTAPKGDAANGAPHVRRLDDVLGRPKQLSEARRVADLEVVLSLALPPSGGGGAVKLEGGNAAGKKRKAAS